MALPKLHNKRSNDSRSTAVCWSSRSPMIIGMFLVVAVTMLFNFPGSPSTISSSLLESSSTSRSTEARTMSRRLKYQYHSPEHRDPGGQKIECGTPESSYEAFFQMTFENRSRYNEDKNIYTLFFKHLTREQMQDYHYIEIGAFDGVRESNTRFFDECLGWTGLLVEPNPKIFPLLVPNRIHSHRMAYATSCSEQEEELNKTVTFYASWFTNAAEDKSASREAYAKSNLATEVPCGSLSPVILDLFSKSKRIHFFSLDVEGMEYAVLQNINFDAIFIDIIMAESVNPYCQDKCEARENVRAFMKTKGYVLYSNTIRDSDLFVHGKSEFLSGLPEEEHMLPVS